LLLNAWFCFYFVKDFYKTIAVQCANQKKFRAIFDTYHPAVGAQLFKSLITSGVFALPDFDAEVPPGIGKFMQKVISRKIKLRKEASPAGSRNINKRKFLSTDHLG